jgi:hypothetical protein
MVLCTTANLDISMSASGHSRRFRPRPTMLALTPITTKPATRTTVEKGQSRHFAVRKSNEPISPTDRHEVGDRPASQGVSLRNIAAGMTLSGRIKWQSEYGSSSPHLAAHSSRIAARVARGQTKKGPGAYRGLLVLADRERNFLRSASSRRRARCSPGSEQ